MIASNTVTWICVALLTPFWWGLFLLLLALAGDVWPRWHVRVSHLFDGFERTRGENPKSIASATQFAA